MTIGEILQKLIEKIEFFDASVSNIVLANIATLSDDDAIVTEKSAIILSIVNIEEDKTLKNQTLYKSPNIEQNTIERYKKPAQTLIISILFSAYNKDNTMYYSGLEKLEIIIKYLQSHNVFYYKGSEFKEQSEPLNYPLADYNKLIMDMISQKTDQVNQMWSYLGSKYMPSVLYTLKLIRIQEDLLPPEDIVKQIKIQLWENNKNDTTGEIETTADISLENN
jgi:Pvc16 N-terminal domain